MKYSNAGQIFSFQPFLKISQAIARVRVIHKFELHSECLQEPI